MNNELKSSVIDNELDGVADIQVAFVKPFVDVLNEHVRSDMLDRVLYWPPPCATSRGNGSRGD